MRRLEQNCRLHWRPKQKGRKSEHTHNGLKKVKGQLNILAPGKDPWSTSSDRSYPATCEGPLSLPECHATLRAMALNKSPVIDGLPTEFYLTFWGTIGVDLVNAFNSSFDVGKLSLTQRSGAITDIGYCKLAPNHSTLFRLQDRC